VANKPVNQKQTRNLTQGLIYGIKAEETTPTRTRTSMTETITTSTEQEEKEAAVLTIDDKKYDFKSLSKRAQELSLDYLRTDQEWNELLYRYRQFVAMQETVTNQLKQEVSSSGMEPIWTEGIPVDSERPLLTIDDKSYDTTQAPEHILVYVQDLLRNNQERSQLEFRLRQLDAARIAYLAAIRQELPGENPMPISSESSSD